MINETQEDVRNLRELYETDGLEAVLKVVKDISINDRTQIDELVKELEEKERDKDILRQGEQLRRLAVATLDSQRDGNKTQTRIWWTLIATIAVTLLIAIFKD